MERAERNKERGDRRGLEHTPSPTPPSYKSQGPGSTRPHSIRDLELKDFRPTLRIFLRLLSTRKISPSATPTTAMSDGKKAHICRNSAFLIVNLAILWSATLAGQLDNPSILRGGLVFTEENPHTPIYANQEFYHVVRNADISQLQEAAVRNSRLLMKYGQRCADIRSWTRASGNISVGAEKSDSEKLASPDKNATNVTLAKYFVISDKFEIREARAVCAMHGAILPELRNHADKDFVQQLAKDHDVPIIMAGIHWHTQDSRFRYNSDHYRVEANIPFTSFEYGGSYKGKHHRETSIQGYWMTSQGKTYPLGYAWPRNDFLVRVLDDDNLWTHSPIICQRLPVDSRQGDVSEAFSNQTNLFLKLAQHNCERDAEGLLEGVSDTFKEISAMTNSRIWDLDKLHRDFQQILDGKMTVVDDYSPNIPAHTRHTRQVAETGAILAGGMVGNLIYSAITGDAPLSWFGKVAGSIFGLVTEADIREYATTLQLHNKQIEALAFNDQELTKAIRNIDDKLNAFIETMVNTINGIAQLNLIQDAREMIRHNIILMETAILKVASVLLASSQGKNSPYALSQADLAILSVQVYASDQITLDTDLSNIQMAAAVLDGQIKIFFKIPVLNEDFLFSFFSVRELPLFTVNGTFVPELDTRYFALSKSNEEYVDLQASEFEQCIRAPMECKITSSTRPISGNAHCTVQTFLEHTLRCPLVQVPTHNRPTYLTYGNTTFYSVPKQVLLFLQCTDYSSSFKAKRNSTQISGQGEISFRPGCSITTADGTKWRTPTIRTGTSLADTNRLVIGLKLATKPTNVTMRFLNSANFTAPTSLTIHNIHESETLSEELTDPTENISFAVRAMAFVASAAILAAMGWGIWKTLKQRSDFCWSCRKGNEPTAPSDTDMTSYKDLSDLELRDSPFSWEKVEGKEMSEIQKSDLETVMAEKRPLKRSNAFRTKGTGPILKPSANRVSFDTRDTSL